ncbi:WD40 containing domain protein [Mycena venus]|uniref:WD40 containing domain protein n=1 Tax=Mycena venus TaxID=2733690 RepID=A0A8H6XQZ7_9AGAR|nr:WD40 containing domain protein [Mycena venus]
MKKDNPSADHEAPSIASESTSQMFRNATDFGIQRSQFMNVQGNVNIHPMVPDVAASGTVTSGRARGQTGASNVQPAVYSESGNYSNQLLYQGRGFPLYVPGPQINLPAAYQRVGVSIGDVGTVTPEGIFDFFFNIYLPSDHPINANDVPEEFCPLPRYAPRDIIHDNFDPGNYISAPSVHEINGDFSESIPGGDFVFDCKGPDGAVLALPYGAHLEKLRNIESMRRYAAKHAENWYRYVNETRGRGLVNGSLYLVTGCEKTKSWGMASFHDVPTEFQLSFRPTRDADCGYRYRWKGAHCRHKHRDSPPDDGTPHNQTTFVHAFTISVCEGIWGKLFGEAEVGQLVDSSTFSEKSGRGFIPYGAQGSSFSWTFFLGGSATGGGTRCTDENGIISDASPIPRVFHPSQMIHEHIFRMAPHATVVITHDDDWRDIFKNSGEDGMRVAEPNSRRLQQAISDRFEIIEEDGAAFLGEKCGSTLPESEENVRMPDVDMADNPSSRKAEYRFDASSTSLGLSVLDVSSIDASPKVGSAKDLEASKEECKDAAASPAVICGGEKQRLEEVEKSVQKCGYTESAHPPARICIPSPDFGPNSCLLPPLPTIQREDIRLRVFTHRSYYARSARIFEDCADDPSPDNEKQVKSSTSYLFEHLGDSVLGIVVTSLIMDMYPGLRVGPSTKVRAKIVGNATLAEISVKYKLPEQLKLRPSQAVVLHTANVQANVFEKRAQDGSGRCFVPTQRPAYNAVRFEHRLQPVRVDSQPVRIDSQPVRIDSQPVRVDSQPCNSDAEGAPPSPSSSSPGNGDTGTNTNAGYLALFNQRLQKRGARVEWVDSNQQAFGEGPKELQCAANDNEPDRLALAHGTKSPAVYSVQVLVDGEVYGRGRGDTKKAARNAAAKQGLARMGVTVW